MNMCFGLRWSVTSFSVLVAAAAAGGYAQIDARLWTACLFLAVKEWIQWRSYLEPECTARNRALTALSWVHISLQPLVVNLFLSALATPETWPAYRIVLVLCAVFALANLLRLDVVRGPRMQTTWCTPDAPNNLCRAVTCSRPGRRHLAYGFRLASADAHSFMPSSFAYALLSFVPGLFLGPRVWAGLHILVALTGVILAPHDAGEAGAIWCLHSSWIGWVTLHAVARHIKGARPN